jgi:exosortase
MPDDSALRARLTTSARWRGWLDAWPLFFGFAVLAIPTLASLARSVWSTEAGAHGPIIIFTGAWLIGRRAASFRELRQEGSGWVAGFGLVVCLAIYAFSRAFDFISLEVAALYGVALAMLYSVFGLQALVRNWFPLGYMAFLIPPPGWVMDQVTGPLKQFVSQASTDSLAALGLPVASEGVTIYVAQYQLLVEDACSGMNSLVGLIAISLFYIYLLRGSSLRYSLALTAFVIPIAVVGNIARIIVLILLTYFFGDAVAQGFLHQLAGVFLFAVDLLLVFAIDSVLARILPPSWRAT